MPAIRGGIMARAKKPPVSTDARLKSWEGAVTQLELTHAACIDNFAVQQELALAAAHLGKQWGLDLEKITSMSREAFVRLGKEVEERTAPDKNPGGMIQEASE
jgi:hypothetical protein